MLVVKTAAVISIAILVFKAFFVPAHLDKLCELVLWEKEAHL
jgi:hypothetical protein